MTDPFSQFMADGEVPGAGFAWLLDSFATPFLKAIGDKWQDNRERAWSAGKDLPGFPKPGRS